MKIVILLLTMYLFINLYTAGFDQREEPAAKSAQAGEVVFPTVWNNGIINRGSVKYVKIIIDREAYVATYEHGDLTGFNKEETTASCDDGTCKIK